tara:strand:- start:404 stop:1945 length:1542 start_codon:yes stop_codon:yes gene_type:complete
MRGYNRLIKEDRTDFIGNLKNKLANKPINGEDLNEIFRCNKKTCFHQFLVYRLINLKFNKALLAAVDNPKKEIYYPLPNLWRSELMNDGFKVPKIYNDLLWLKFNLKWYLIGVLTGIIQIFRILFEGKNKKENDSAFFINLYPGNLLQNSSLNSHNLLEWFALQPEAKKINKIYHSCKAKCNTKLINKIIKYRRTPLPNISFKKVIKFLFWFFFKAITSLFTFENRLLLRELVLENITKLSNPNELCGYYLFHNSGHILRPLWSYVAEKRGSKIIFYFYSTNITSFKVKQKNHIQDFQWQVTSWSKYWVWNQTQVNFLKRNILKSFDLIIKGIIPFTSSTKNFTYKETTQNDSLLIFDVPPTRQYFYAGTAPTVDFYTLKNMVIFLDWIDHLAQFYGLNVFLKTKRKSPLTSKIYINKIVNLKKNKGWVEIDSEIDANYVCSKLQPIASISVPFTSAAIISKKNKIPSAYLDPTKNLDKKFLINNEVSLLLSKEELFQWFSKYVLKNHEKTKN